MFRKKTHTDRYLDFESHHPLAHKAAVARTLLTRADRICTDFPDKAREKELVTQVLRMNGYPRELVTKNWKPTARPHRPEVSDTPKAKVILPYVWHLLDNTEDSNPLGDQHLFSASPHPPLDFGAPKRSHTPTTADRCGVLDPMQ